MIKKLFPLLALAAAVTAATPELRARVVSSVEPVVEARLLRPIMNPFMSWLIRDDLKLVLRKLIERNARGETLPHPNVFQDFLKENFVLDRQGKDPWGQLLHLQVTIDSIFVVSSGPDGLLGTLDDVRVSGPRR
ncbi:MAG: hypothetical protein HY703_04380 [Gemmatimonadetes bacterium]|nr:hypothetical protein [Gemmatimonadota bacterium]